jgi:hypothetical protein
MYLFLILLVSVLAYTHGALSQREITWLSNLQSDYNPQQVNAKKAIKKAEFDSKSSSKDVNLFRTFFSWSESQPSDASSWESFITSSDFNEYNLRKTDEALLVQNGYSDEKMVNSYFEWSKKHGNSHDITAWARSEDFQSANEFLSKRSSFTDENPLYIFYWRWYLQHKNDDHNDFGAWRSSTGENSFNYGKERVNAHRYLKAHGLDVGIYTTDYLRWKQNMGIRNWNDHVTEYLESYDYRLVTLKEAKRVEVHNHGYGAKGQFNEFWTWYTTTPNSGYIDPTHPPTTAPTHHPTEAPTPMQGIPHRLESLRSTMATFGYNDIGNIKTTLENAGFKVFATPTYGALTENLKSQSPINTKGKFDDSFFRSNSEIKLSSGFTSTALNHYAWYAFAAYDGSTFKGFGVMLYRGYQEGTSIKDLFYPVQNRPLYTYVLNADGTSHSSTNWRTGTHFSDNARTRSNGYYSTQRFSYDDGIWGFSEGYNVNGDDPGPGLLNAHASHSYGVENYHSSDSGSTTRKLYWGSAISTSQWTLVAFTENGYNPNPNTGV